MISFVIPTYNEEESLGTLYEEIVSVGPSLASSFEIIFVDDGSTDTSLQQLETLAKKDKNVHVYSFRRNRGKAEALMLGFHKAKGGYIATLDADLQDRASELPKLLEKMKDGCDMVIGWRKDRNDRLFTTISSKVFNTIAAVVWGVHLHDYNSGLKLFRKEAAASLHLYGGLHRFIPVLLVQNGFAIAEVPVVHAKRKFGKSKFGMSKIWKDFPDMFTMFFLSRYSERPLHFFGPMGMFLLVVGVGVLGYLSVLHFQGEAIGNRPLLVFGVLFVLSGFQVFFTGFLADLMISMSHNDKETGEENERLMLRFSSDS